MLFYMYSQCMYVGLLPTTCNQYIPVHACMYTCIRAPFIVHSLLCTCCLIVCKQTAVLACICIENSSFHTQICSLQSVNALISHVIKYWWTWTDWRAVRSAQSRARSRCPRGRTRAAHMRAHKSPSLIVVDGHTFPRRLQQRLIEAVDNQQ